MKILILANHYNTLRVFRRDLLKQLSASGHEIIVSLPPTDDDNRALIESYGCSVVTEEQMERRAVNPVKDMLLLKNYIALIKRIKPDKVITYTIKCNIYGAQACKMLHIPCYCNVTGLGSAFQGETMTKKLVSMMYKFSMNKAEKVFFENVGNRDTMVEAGLIKKDRTVVMAGAGVNLDEFPFAAYPEESGTVRFIFVGRVMAEKGVDELFYAIKKMKDLYGDAVAFDFIGWYEDNYSDTVEELMNKGYINYYGFQENVVPFILNAHCVVHPSYHEGMSNTLLEGAAMGRPLITTDIHGCKEAVADNQTGYLVRVRDREDLFEKMQQFFELPYEQKAAMGKAGRAYMEQHFDKKDVVNKTVEELGL